MRRSTRAAGWRDDLLGALNATASILPFVLGYGFIAFAALGPVAAQAGLMASTIAVVLGGAALATFGASRLPAASPTASVCVVLGSTLQGLVVDPTLAASTPEGTARVLAAGAAVVVMSGLLMMLLGAVRAGSLVRFVPQPVLAGLMNGVAVLIVLSQLPALLGVSPDALQRDGWRALAGWRGAQLAIGLGTAALMVGAARRWPRAPAALIALTVAGVAAWLLRSAASTGSLGPAPGRIGSLTAGPPHFGAILLLREASEWRPLVPHLPGLVLGALVVALIGALESVLNLASVQQEIGEPAEPDRELIATGAAGLVSGLFGGLPVVYMRTRAVATLRGGGRGPRSLWIGSGLMALVMTVGLGLIGQLSTAAVAGVVVVLAFGLVDRWSHALVRRFVRRWSAGDDRRDLGQSLAIVTLVAIVVVAWSVAAALTAGVVVSVVVFIRTLHRQLVRARYTAVEFPSRRVYAKVDEAVLAPLRAHIRVVELEGALFFGSAERLTQEADRAADGATDVIIDLRRLTALDASGSVALVEAGRRLERRGVRLRLAGVRPGDRRDAMLRSHGAPLLHESVRDAAVSDDDVDPAGGGKPLRTHPDVDRAVEAAERRALDRASPLHASRHVTLADCQLLQGLSERQFADLAPLFASRRLAAGERLFLEGDPGDALYVVVEGAISAIDARRDQRFATLLPGMCFGETALLDGASRTADMVADVDSVVYGLTKVTIEALHRSMPEIAAQLYANMARHLAGRLRAASTGWRWAAE